MNMKQLKEMPNWMHATFGVLEALFCLWLLTEARGVWMRGGLAFAALFVLLAAMGNLAIHVAQHGWTGQRGKPRQTRLDNIVDDPTWKKLLGPKP